MIPFLLCSVALSSPPVGSIPGADSPEAGPRSATTLVASADEIAIHKLIDDQIAAFRRRDAEAAWAPVAPGLKQKFGTADNFLQMVLLGYRPVADPRSYQFDGLAKLPNGDWGQLLKIVGPDGEEVRALYLLEKQADGTWRTSGCLLIDDDEGPNVG